MKKNGRTVVRRAYNTLHILAEPQLQLDTKCTTMIRPKKASFLFNIYFSTFISKSYLVKLKFIEGSGFPRAVIFVRTCNDKNGIWIKLYTFSCDDSANRSDPSEMNLRNLFHGKIVFLLHVTDCVVPGVCGSLIVSLCVGVHFEFMTKS